MSDGETVGLFTSSVAKSINWQDELKPMELLGPRTPFLLPCSPQIDFVLQDTMQALAHKGTQLQVYAQ